MSFSAAWLALREPADHQARNSGLRDAVATSLAGSAHVTIVDLACGSGSNLRGLAAHLPKSQTWRLVDHDPLLLAAAREALVVWADRIESSDPLILVKGDRRIDAVFREFDLAVDPGPVLDGADLVTAAAFFDLVSSSWIDRFCAELARRELPLYTVLTYSGEEVWLPPHTADAAVLGAFHEHQASDKGFGRAAGPRAASLLVGALEGQGYRVAAAESPWLLGRSEAELMQALADGAAAVVAKSFLVRAATVADWQIARRTAASCRIGHIDLFAQPPRTEF